ncbi:MAG: acyl-CoA dehydrogenase family protein [Saprospiraceae bacterium]|nr:acyl-CoA dehydrogenase family protein [Saprospiraceae bacterium]
MENLFATDKLNDLLPRIKAFVETELYPLETVENLTKPFSKIEKVLNKKRELVKAAGLWGLQHHLTLVEFGQVSEVLAMTPLGHYVFNCQAPDIGNMELMEKHATDQLKHDWLVSLMKGETRSCFAMTEPGFAGSNPINLGTTAVKEGNYYVINGRKWFTTAADGAHFCIVMAITDPDAPPHKRASQILVSTDTEGFKVERNISIMGESGDGWLSHSEVTFTNCCVPLTNLIGTEGAGFQLAQERLGPGRIHHCMRWIGIAERAFDIMCRRAISRDMGDGQRLAEKQFVMGWIAESRAEIDAARLMVLSTAKMIDEEGAAAARNRISSIKFFTAKIMLDVVDRAIQTCGAAGLTDEFLLSFWYRHERAARIYDGADEVHKIALAKSILKKYA